MTSTKITKSQLDLLREEKALLDTEIKEKRGELSLLRTGKSDPRYKDMKVCLLFLMEKRNIVHLKVKYREDNNIETVRSYKSSSRGVQVIIEEFEEEREELRTEISELREQVASERKKKRSKKGDAFIAQLEDTLASRISIRKSVSSKICYHRKKLKL